MKKYENEYLFFLPTPALPGSGSMGVISAFRHPFIYGGKDNIFFTEKIS